MNEPKTVVLYHANCPDGFTAAWLWSFNQPDALLIPLNHNSTKRFHGLDPEVLRGNIVYMFDIAFKLEDCMEANELCAQFEIHDHHVSAMQEVGHLPYAHFDMNQSGAMLAWRFFEPKLEAPLIVQYIQDRDLWKFTLEHSKEICAWLDTIEFDFEEWNLASLMLSNYFNECLTAGIGILAYQDKLIKIALSNASTIKIQDHVVPIIYSIDYTLVSEALNRLSIGQPFSVACNFDGYTYKFSLRSDPKSSDSVDVSAIAVHYGGGGHKHAAGFAILHSEGL